MVDLTKTVELIFSGTDKTGQAIQSIGGGLSDLERGVGNVTGPLADFTKSILATEVAIAAASLAMTAYAVNQAGDFKTSVSEIGTLFNGTEEQVRGLSGEIITYARTSTASIDEINQAVYKAISTGTDYADSVKLVGDAEILATAGRANLAEVTDLLTSSLNAYGDGTLEAADYSDILFTAVQKGNTNIPELATNIGKVTGIAAAADVPFDTLAAALSALTITSGNTAKSSTILKALLNELISPSDQLSVAMGGVTLKADGLDGVMRQLFDATGGTASEMSELFGSTEAMQGALALASDSSGAFAGALDGMANRAGVASAANDVLSKSFESVNQNLKNMIQTTFISAGDPLLDDWADVADGLGHIFENLQLSFGADVFTQLYNSADEASAELSDTLRAIAEALPDALDSLDMSGLLSAYGELGEGIAGLFGDLDLTNADDLSKAIQIIIDGIEALTRVSAGIVEGLTPFLQTLGELVIEINSTDDATKNLIGQVLGWGTAVDTVLPSVGFLAETIQTVGAAAVLAGSAKSLGAVVTLTGALTALLTGGAATGIGFGVYQVTDLALKLSALSDIQAANTAHTEAWSEAYKKAGDDFGAAAILMVNSGKDISYLSASFEDLYGVSLKLAAQHGSVAEAQKVLADETKSASEASKEQGGELIRLAEIQLQNLDASEDLAAAKEAEAANTGVIITAAGKLADEYRSLSTAQREALSDSERSRYLSSLTAEALEKEREARTNNATEIDTQREAIEKESGERLKELELLYDYGVALEEISSNERIKQLEFAVNLDIAKLETDAEKAVAIIEGLSDSINSTGDVIGDLFGLFGDDNISGLDQTKIERQLRLENERRQEALDLQKKLTEAQIDNIQAQTERLSGDDALIKIEADGLEPEIRAFMFKILDNIRTEMSRDNLAFITGIQ